MSSKGACVAVAIFVVGVATGVGQPASATAPGDDGALAFVRFDKILTVRKVGDDVQYRVLTPTGNYRHPRWSQDGARLVFGTKFGAVKTINADGSGIRTVLTEGGYQPNWMSLSRIAFVKVTAGKGDIYAIDAAGGAVARLTWDGPATCGNSHPAFSYDGRYFAYIQERPVGGSCALPLIALKMRDQVTGTTRVVTSLPFNGSTTELMKSRVDVTADGRHVMVRIEGGCRRDWAMVNVVTGAVGDWAGESGCEHGPWYDEAYPFPSGGNSIEDAFLGLGWQDADMQPLPR